MILIVGSNHDDVLYYETVLKGAKEVEILNRYHALVGTIFTQEVMVLQDIYTSFVSSTVAMYILDKYFISAIINVGRCSILRGDLRIGDIALSESVMFGDVDQIANVKGTRLGQIPGYPLSFNTDLKMINNMNKALETLFNERHANATFISSSFFRQNKEDVVNLSEDEYIQSLNNNIVLDGESAGFALAGYLHNTPFISVKIIEAKGGNYTSLEDYLSILRQYGSLGKAVVAFIGEISRTDIVRA